MKGGITTVMEVAVVISMGDYYRYEGGGILHVCIPTTICCNR